MEPYIFLVLFKYENIKLLRSDPQPTAIDYPCDHNASMNLKHLLNGHACHPRKKTHESLAHLQ